MVDVSLLKGITAISDQIGDEPATTTVGVWEPTETFRIVELPTKIETNNLGHAFILDSATNGVLGTNTGTIDGQQATLGTGGRFRTIKRVNSQNNTGYEFVRDMTLLNATGTATINLTNHDITFTIGQTAYILLSMDTTNIVSATLEQVGIVVGTLNYLFGVSANAETLPVTWTSTTLNNQTQIPIPNKALWLKVLSSGNATLDIEGTDGKSFPIRWSYNY